MAASIKIRKEATTIHLKRTNLRNGEYLLYRLKVWGDRGIFTLSEGEQKILMKDTDFPVPQREFVCIWPKKKNEIQAESVLTHTLSVSFASASKYTFSVQHHKTDGSQIEIIKDVDLECDDAKEENSTELHLMIV